LRTATSPADRSLMRLAESEISLRLLYQEP
jgi:hypothetical protein